MQVDKQDTHNILLDAVDLGVVLRHRNAGVQLLAHTLVVVVDQLANLDHTGLLESPSCDLLRKLAVRRLDSLAVEGGLFREPLVLQQLSGTENGQARGVVGLHRRNNVQLLASSEWVLGSFDLILGVVAVCSARRAQNGLDERALVTQRLAHSPRYRNDSLTSKVVLNIRSDCLGKWQKQDIVFIRSGGRVVVEMVNDKLAFGGRDLNIELEK